MNTMHKNPIQIIELTCESKENNIYLLKITASYNEIGIIYKVAAVLFAHGWDIEDAVAETIEGKLVKDIFGIRNLQGKKMTDHELTQIKSDLYSLLRKEISVADYLEKSAKDFKKYKKPCSSKVELFNPPLVYSTVLDIRTLDRPGLLLEVTQILYYANIDIISITAKTEYGKIRDSFLLCTPDSDRLSEVECNNLKQQLLIALS